MRTLLDTNILLRHANSADPLHSRIAQALRGLVAAENELVVAPQNLFEYWVVATRPAGANGLGLTPAVARSNVDIIISGYSILPDPPNLLRDWLDICTKHAVAGRPAHDARLVAFMFGHKIHRLLSLNPADFSRYEIECIEIDR